MAGGYMVTLDVAEIAATKHSEKTVLAPSWVPTISHQPVLESSTLPLRTSGWRIRRITRAHFCRTIVWVCQQAICKAPAVRHSSTDSMADVVRIAICALTPTNDLHSMP